MVASVPELENRHNGSPKRLASSPATTMASSVGWAKCVPRGALPAMASTIFGCPWPTAPTP